MRPRSDTSQSSSGAAGAAREPEAETVVALPPSPMSPADLFDEGLEHDTDEIPCTPDPRSSSPPRAFADELADEIALLFDAPMDSALDAAALAPQDLPAELLAPRLPSSSTSDSRWSVLHPDTAAEPPAELPAELLSEIFAEGGSEAPPESASYLSEAALFELEPLAENAIEGAATAAASDEAPACWPSNVPSLSEAAEALCGRTDIAGPIREVTERLRASLSPAEQETLEQGELAFHPTVLRGAILVRWRLELALELRPKRTEPADTAALTQLLSEVDRVLVKLNSAELDPGLDLAAAFEASRACIVTNAVEVAEIGARAPAAVKPKSEGRKKEPRAIFDATMRRPRTARERVMRAALQSLFAIAVVGAAVFHAARFTAKTGDSRPATSVAAASGVSGGMITARDDANNITVFRPLGDGPVETATLEKMKAEAAAAGKTILELGPSEFVMVPQSMGRDLQKGSAQTGGRP